MYARFYCVQTCPKEWHHCPLWHTNGRPATVPHAHRAAACLPSMHPGTMRLCILASANPTDMAIASSAIAQSNIVRFHFLITASAKAPAALAMFTQSAAPWTAWCAWCTGQCDDDAPERQECAEARDWLGARPVHHRRALSGTAAHGPEYLRQHPSEAMDLVNKTENDADAFVVDA